MNNRIIILILILFLNWINPIKLFSQIGIKGTFIIVAIGNDGIMIASDSRGVIYDTKDSTKRILAIYDSINKSFLIKNQIALVSTGDAVIGDKFLESIIKNYEKNLKICPNIKELLIDFYKYCKDTLPDDVNTLFFVNKMICAGFENNVPVICLSQDGELVATIGDGIIESYKTILSEKYKNELYSKKLSCYELGLLAEKTITEYAVKSKLTEIIGGKIRILHLKPGGYEWIKNKPSRFKWTKGSEFIQDVKLGNVYINYTSTENFIKFWKLFK
jgi:hypothetical protein